VVVPVLPLMLFTVLLSWLIEPAARLAFLEITPDRFIARPQREYVHLGDMLTYYSLAALHTLLCVGVIAILLRRMRGLSAERLKSGAIFLVAILLLLVAIGVFFERKADEQVLVQLGFKATCRLVEAAALPTQLTAPGCFGAGINRFTWLAWLPTFSGMGATAVAAAFAYAMTCASSDPAAGDDRTSPAWREAIEQRVRNLQHGVYLLSAVLVSSTITITQFAHLPVGLLLNKDGDLGLAAAAAKYAAGLSTFWGALFSLTLIATFAVPALRVWEEAYGGGRATSGGVDLERWLDENVFQSIKRQIGTVLSLLAPLLAGPLSSLLSSFTRL
jgi:hypothetical protein